MNSTFPPLKPSKSQIVRPSGIIQSKDGKYFFWQCNHCGVKTFANAKRFDKLVKQYGSEEALFKTFICKAAKKAAGVVEAPKVKEVRAKKAKASKVTNDVVDEPSEAPKARKAKEIKVEEKPVYEWQKEANFFGAGKIVPVPLNIEEASKDSCFYPPFALDDLCKGCPIYDKCNCYSKHPPEDWTDKSKRFVPKKKQMVFVADTPEATK